jgi:hypothetical protein
MNWMTTAKKRAGKGGAGRKKDMRLNAESKLLTRPSNMMAIGSNNSRMMMSRSKPQPQQHSQQSQQQRQPSKSAAVSNDFLFLRKSKAASAPTATATAAAAAASTSQQQASPQAVTPKRIERQKATETLLDDITVSPFEKQQKMSDAIASERLDVDASANITKVADLLPLVLTFFNDGIQVDEL